MTCLEPGDDGTWAIAADQKGSYHGWTAYVVSPEGRRISVGFCCASYEEAQRRAEAARPVWAGFYRREKLTVIRVDGEIGDALFPDEQADAPSMTDVQRGWEAEAMRERLH